MDTLPSSLQLAGAVAGLVALVLSVGVVVRGIIQRFQGKPKIEVEFDIEDASSGKLLKCQIFNRPIRSRIIHFLGIHREAAEDIGVVVRIREVGSGKLVGQETLPLINTHTGPTSERIRLISSHSSARFGVVAWVDSSGAVFTIKDLTTLTPEAGSQPLEPGRYIARIDVVDSVRDKTTASEHGFVVGQARHELRWVAI